MPSDDRNQDNDRDRFDDEEDDLFKKYSSKESKGFREEEDFLSDENNRERDNISRKNSREDDFFTDDDFEFKDYEDEDYDISSLRSAKVKQKRKRTRAIVSAIVIMAILALVAVGIVFGYRFIKNKYFSSTAETLASEEEAIVVPSSMKLGKDMSIIICGAGENLLEPEINSILFSKYSSSKTELVTLCVPVNTLFEIPGFGLDNLAKSVEYGGMDLMKLTIKNNIGMDVNNFILMDVVNIVNKLEGIKLNLDKPLAIDSGGSKIELKEGDNILNGETALAFMRYFSGRTADVGLSDIDNQKLITDAIMKKIFGSKEGDLAKNLSRINDYMDTDLNLEELSEFISTVSGLSEDTNKAYVLDGRFEPLDGGAIVFVPDITRVLDIFKQENITETPESVEDLGQMVTISVLNGVGTKGIAGNTADFLKTMKFSDGTLKYNLEKTGDADNYEYDKTKIILRAQDEPITKAAENIRSLLLVGEVVDQTSGDQAEDIIIIIGKDFDYNAAVSAFEQGGQAAGETAQETETTQAQAAQVYDLNILNGEGTQGIALTVKKILEDNLNKDKVTINVKETKNADNFGYTATKIIINSGKEGASGMADKIKGILGTGEVSESSSNPDNVDITVIIGSDYTK